MLLKNGRILRSDYRFFTGDMRVEDDRIVQIGALEPQPGETVHQLEEKLVLPGLIETHFHGAMGLDSSLGEERAFATFSSFMAAHGITSFVPALISSPDAVTEHYLAAGRAYMDHPAPGAQMVGMYLEGPFISPEHKGAHDPAVLQLPDLAKVQRWQQLAGGRIRKLLVAPELPGAEPVIRWAAGQGIVTEIGHSGASYEQAKAAIEWGATLATHVFNAMSPLHHRQPGILAAVLLDDRVTCELIADLGHVAQPVVELLYRLKGENHIDLISDAFSAAGLPEGTYIHTDGRPIIVKGGLARLEDGTLMGSTSTILDGMRNLVRRCGVPLESAVRTVTANPARTLGLHDRGCLAPGKRADLAVLDEQLTVCATYVGGREVYRRPENA